MSNRFLPIAGVTVVLAIVVYAVLSFVFPHQKEVLVDTQVKAEAVFGAELNEAEAQPTAIAADLSGAAVATTTEMPAAETPAEAAAEPVAETVEAPVETAAEPVSEAPATAEEPSGTEAPAPTGAVLSRAELAKIVAEAAAKAAAETAKSIAEQATRDAAGQ